MASVRTYLDEDVRPLLAEILRNRGYDAISATRTHRRGLTDQEQLQVAIEEKRILVTHNIRDFIQIHRTSSGQHSGILVSNQEPLNVLLRRLLYFLSRETATSVQERLIWLSDYEPPH